MTYQFWPPVAVIPHKLTAAIIFPEVNVTVPPAENALPATGPVKVPLNPVPLIVPLAVVPETVPATVPVNAVPLSFPLMFPLIAPLLTVPLMFALTVEPCVANDATPLNVAGDAHAAVSVYNANAYADPALIANGVDVPANVSVWPFTVAGPRNGSCHVLAPGARYAI